MEITKIIITILIAIIISAVFLFICKFVLKKCKPVDNQTLIFGCKYDARIDILNTGKDDNDIDVLKKIPSDMKVLKYDKKQFKTINGNFKSCVFLAASVWQKGKIEFKAKGDGYLTVFFMSIYLPDENGTVMKILVDYKNAKLNGETIFTDTKTLWHDEREIYTVQAIDDEVYTLEFEYKIPDSE